MQPLQAKLRWEIDVRPLHRETSPIRFVPTSERRRAIVTCSATMCASTGVTGYPRSASCPRRRAIALRHSRRLCAAAGTLPPPLLDGRKSVLSTAHANMHASIGVTGCPRSGKLPAPSRHRSPALMQTVRGSRLSPTAASRSSKIGRAHDLRQLACKHRCDRIPKIGKLPAPSRHCSELDDTSAPVRVGISRVDPTATCWPTPCHTKRSRNPRSANCLRAIAL